MDTFSKLVTRWPKTVIAIILACTALAGAALVVPGLGMDPNPYPLDRSHPSMVAYRQLKQDYTGTLETALILLRHPESAFNPGTLERVARLTEALEQLTLPGPGDEAALASFLPRLAGDSRDALAAILAQGLGREDDFSLTELELQLAQGNPAPPGLARALADLRLKLYPIRKVTSLANAENISARGDELVVGPVFAKPPRDRAAVQAVAEQVRGNPLFRKLLISTDERSTGILVETYIPEERSEMMLALNGEIERLLRAIPGEEETYVAGVPVMSATAVQTMQQDNATLFPVVIALVLLILTLTFRTFTGVLLPMGVVIISVLWTLGVMVAVGVPLNMITTTLPVFLITIGVADGIHLVSEFQRQLARLENRREAVLATLRHLTLPVVMTSITTAAGFISLTFTDIRYIRFFGIFVALGVLVAMVFSLVFIPAVLLLGRDRPRPTVSTGRPARFAWLDRLGSGVLLRVTRLATERPGRMLAVWIVLLGLGGLGMSRVVVENDFVNFFRADMPIVQATRALDRHLAGSNVINLLVSAPAGEPEPFKDPANLAPVEALQAELERLPFVGRSLSLVDILKRINRVMHRDDPAFDRLPADRPGIPGRNLVAQYLLLYENGGGENLTDRTDGAFRTLNVTLTLTTRNTTLIQQLLDEASRFAAERFPPGMTLRFAGSAELATASNNEVVRGQIVSLSLSLGVVFLLLLAEFRSLSKGLLAMIPLSVTVVLNFGTMGLFAIPLNMATAIISSVVIGIGVDFAIHYLTRLQLELQAGGGLQAALHRTMAASGKAISANAVTVATGFLAMLFSDMLPLRYVGWLVSQTLLVSMAGTLLMLPAAIVLFRPAFSRSGAAAPQEGAASVLGGASARPLPAPRNSA